MEASGPFAVVRVMVVVTGLQADGLQGLERVAHAADLPLAEAAFALHLAQGVGQVVEVGDGTPEEPLMNSIWSSACSRAGFFPLVKFRWMAGLVPAAVVVVPFCMVVFLSSGCGVGWG